MFDLNKLRARSAAAAVEINKHNESKADQFIVYKLPGIIDKAVSRGAFQTTIWYKVLSLDTTQWNIVTNRLKEQGFAVNVEDSEEYFILSWE